MHVRRFSVVLCVLVVLSVVLASAAAKSVLRSPQHESFSPAALAPPPPPSFELPSALRPDRDDSYETEIGLFNYLDLYYCHLSSAKPVALLVIFAWLGMLFATIGIAASDFFCVNLSTIANALGMSESMAGVTFLAFGNGSPDVFSTFAAMKINSGSLAVGELIGAASFIAAVVAGSMAIVRPFRVGRKSFLRDVGFFMVSVLFGVVSLADGKIGLVECAIMVVFYSAYVVFVVVWHMMAVRRRNARRKERHVREHYTAPEEEEDLLHDEEDEDGNVGGNTQEDGALQRDLGALERGEHDEEEGEEDEEEGEEQAQAGYAELSNNMRVRPGKQRKSTSLGSHGIRPSLLGAMEFRAVLTSLEKHRNIHSHKIILRRYSDDPFLHALPQSRHSASGAIRQSEGELNIDGRVQGANANGAATPQSILKTPPFDGRTRAVSMGDAGHVSRVDIENLRPLPIVDVDDPSHRQCPSPLPLRVEVDHLSAPSPLSSGRPSPTTPARRSPRSPLCEIPLVAVSDSNLMSTRPCVPPNYVSPVPSIQLPQPVLEAERETLSMDAIFDSAGRSWRRFKWWPYFLLPPPQQLAEVFFPTLRGFEEKTSLERISAVVAILPVFLLTLTLPVVEGNDSEVKEDVVDSSETNRSEATSAVREPLQKESMGKDWNRWLVATQCITAPLFVAVAFSSPSRSSPVKLLLCAALVGLIALLLLLIFTRPEKPPRFRYLLCFAGFAVAITWISMVAEEVVAILKALGVIFGISDAILGLTIFAVGNSLGDLVANITVAKLGYPVMALSACFGGPMLNILLGIGISGGYLNLIRGREYHIEVSSTLAISAATLLVTLVVLAIAVPMSGWRMTRGIGVATIVIWIVSTVGNVMVEAMGWGWN